MRRTTLLFGACWAFAVEPSSAFSLVPNGSFENGSPTPADWRIEATPRPGGLASFATDFDSVGAGARSLRLEATGPATIEVTSLPFDVPPESRSRSYLLSLRYRGIGLSSNHLFQGVNVVFAVAWRDAADREIERVAVAAPYSPQPWSPLISIMEAPARTVRATIHASLFAREGSLPTTVWIDDVRLRPWRTEPSPEPKVRSWSVGKDEIQSNRVRVVADDDTPSGYSAIANPRFVKQEMYLVDGLQASGIPAGAYRADFRIRTLPSRSPEAVFEIDGVNNSILNGVLSSRKIRANDLPDSSQYRDFPLAYFVPPTGRNSFRVRWFGGVATWVDSITLTEERLIDAAKFDDLLSP